MPINPLTLLAIAQTAGNIGKSLFGGKAPTYQAKPYSFDLPQAAKSYLSQQAGAENVALGQQRTQAFSDVASNLASRGISGGAAISAERGVGRQYSDAFTSLLSEQARRALGLIETINRFGQGERGMEFGSERMASAVGQGNIMDIINSLMGTGTTIAGQQLAGREAKSLEDTIREVFGGRGGGGLPQNTANIPFNPVNPSFDFGETNIFN